MQQGTGALDRDDPEQEAKFEYYFGPNRKISANPKDRIIYGSGVGRAGLPHPGLAIAQAARSRKRKLHAFASSQAVGGKGWSPSLTLDKYLKRTRTLHFV